jgi:hypothetical protein
MRSATVERHVLGKLSPDVAIADPEAVAHRTVSRRFLLEDRDHHFLPVEDFVLPK